MKCPRCAHENPQGARFCEECATPLARPCSNCGTTLSSTAKFCHACAHPVASAGSTPARSPETYTPKHLAERILTSKTALEGERKQVTVLFADLKGSMELLADRDPEEARKLLDPVLERMMEAVHRYEGTVNQVMGDGIMALFGAPLAHEDHAVRACYAALRMHGAVRQYAEDLRRSQGVDVQIRVGLNSGEVIVRSIGSDLHMDYTAVGQTTHLASRMEQLARPGTTLVTGDTLRLCEGYVQVTSLGPTPIKGLSAPVEVYELTGAGAARTRFQAAAARGLTRFVGRDGEIEQLRRALDRAAAGHGQVVAAVGEAGVGKSRLFYEFTHSHRVQDWLIVESGSVSYGKATTYLPVIDLLKTYFKVQDRDDQREVRDKVIGRVLGLDRSLEPLLSPMLALLDVPVEDPGWDVLDPPQRRQRTLDAVKRLLLRESRVQPLLLVIEDLHWIDSETQALLDSLVDSLGSIRVLLLVNYRPEYEAGWGRKTYYTQVRLESLPPESTDELLHALLGDAPGLEPLKQMLRRRGNPFFLEETVRTLVETKALDGERGAYRLMRPVESLQIPATVQAILAARIDRLPVEDKQLLLTASVIGKDVPFAILMAIAELPEEALRRALAHLQEAEFLYEATLFPDLEYTFKHALTHEVAYGSLLQERRRALHARIVDVIERLYPDRLNEHVELLAHHAARGQLWNKALGYLGDAGRKAVGRSAFRDGASFFEAALGALRHLPDSRETLEQAIDIRISLNNSLYAVGDVRGGLSHLREAADLARKVGDDRRLARALHFIASSVWMTGDALEARKLARNTLVIAEALADRTLTFMANYTLAVVAFLLGDYEEAEVRSGKVLHAPEGGPTRVPGFPRAAMHGFMAWARGDQGRFEEGSAEGLDGLRVAEASGRPFSVTWACWGLANLYGIQGNHAEALRLCDRAIAVSRAADLGMWPTFLGWTRGHLYARSGRVAEGTALLREALADHKAHSFGAWESRITTHLAEAYLSAGRLDAARDSAVEALTLARARKEYGHEAYALRLLAEISALCDPSFETAERHYREAMTLAAERSMRPLVAHCHLGLGKLYRRTEKREQAQKHLVRATKMYREMGMTFWLEKAEAEITGLT